MKDRKEYLRQYYQTHKTQMESQHQKWIKNNPEQYRSIQRYSNRKYRTGLKLKIIDFLGGKCSNPNCPIPPEKMNKEALQIDHINNNGAIERKTIGRNNIKFYLHVLRKIQSGSKDYQLLCAYCNWIKQFKKRGLK